MKICQLLQNLNFILDLEKNLNKLRCYNNCFFQNRFVYIKNKKTFIHMYKILSKK